VAVWQTNTTQRVAPENRQWSVRRRNRAHGVACHR